jgi:hypothetical protein
MTQKPTYAELLQHPKWQERRLEVLKLHGFKCMECGDTETMLHVHHTSYIKGLKPWEYHDIFFVVLCKHCHKKKHEPDQEELKDPVPGYCTEILPFVSELFQRYPYNNFFSRIVDQIIERSEK